MSYFLSVLIVIVGVLSVYMIRAFSRVMAKAAREYMDASNKFFRSAKPLIEDSETPDEIVELICTLNNTITDRRMASKLVSNPLHRRWSGKTNRLFKVTAEFFAARPELEDSFSALVTSWFVAVTALSPIAGMAARYSLSNSESMRTAAAQESLRRVQHSGGDDKPGNTNGIAHAH